MDEPLKTTTFGAAPSFCLTSANALVIESVFETSTVTGIKPSFWRGFLDPTATLYPSCFNLFATARPM